MKVAILRRRKLGRTSCREVAANSTSDIKVVRNDLGIPADLGMVFRWGCTSNIPGNPVVVNHAGAIHKVSDKAGFRKLTADAGLAPKTWLSYEEAREALEGGLQPLIVRRATHHQGRFLEVCTTGRELVQACQKYGEGNYYISEMIDKVAEYRVFIAQGRVVWVAKKTPADPKAVAWNVAQGGRFDNVRWDEWPLKAIRIAREAFLLSGLDFGGVDVMVDDKGNAYVLEINSAPSQTSPYRQSCTAKAFDYIVKHGKKAIPIIEERGGWKKFIHPSISDQAILGD